MFNAVPGIKESSVGIVQKTDTATQNIAAGSTVIWKGKPCVASSAIVDGETLSSLNLTEQTNGIYNYPLIIERRYSASYTANANSYAALTSSDFSLSPSEQDPVPAGYSAIGYSYVTSGANTVIPYTFNPKSLAISLRNITDTNQSRTCTVCVLYMRDSQHSEYA